MKARCIKPIAAFRESGWRAEKAKMRRRPAALRGCLSGREAAREMLMHTWYRPFL